MLNSASLERVALTPGPPCTPRVTAFLLATGQRGGVGARQHGQGTLKSSAGICPPMISPQACLPRCRTKGERRRNKKCPLHTSTATHTSGADTFKGIYLHKFQQEQPESGTAVRVRYPINIRSARSFVRRDMTRGRRSVARKGRRHHSDSEDCSADESDTTATSALASSFTATSRSSSIDFLLQGAA